MVCTFVIACGLVTLETSANSYASVIEGAQQWVFGGINPQTKECFMVEVDQCDAQTLIRIIR
ncbi:hypothetical protein I4U23_005444 [Adineta vaga]|nr:hypothetical protein I4U23_005444 [Adineta vaga]